jgi:hypothetical protein
VCLVVIGVGLASIAERAVTVGTIGLTGQYLAGSRVALDLGYVVVTDFGIAVDPGSVVAAATVHWVGGGIDLTPIAERAVTVETASGAVVDLARPGLAEHRSDALIAHLVGTVDVARPAERRVGVQVGVAPSGEQAVAIAPTAAAAHNLTAPGTASGCRNVLSTFLRAAVLAATTFLRQTPPASKSVRLSVHFAPGRIRPIAVCPRLVARRVADVDDAADLF